MGEQIFERNGAGARLGFVERTIGSFEDAHLREFGRVFGDGVVERNFAFIGEHERGERGDGLGHGGDAEDGVVLDRELSGEVAPAGGGGFEGAVAPDCGDGAGKLAGVYIALYHLLGRVLAGRVAEVTGESYEMGEAWIREMVKKEDLPMPAGHLVRVIHVLTEGLVFQRLLTPELVPDQVIRSAFLALAKRR